jgi:uncharacterized coiled-coil protein SlyX
MARATGNGALKNVLRSVSGHRYVFAFTAAAFALTVLLGAPRIPVKYTGATVLQQRTDPAAEEVTRRPNESAAATLLRLQDELAGRAAMERAVVDLGLATDVPRGPDGRPIAESREGAQALVQRLLTGVKIEWDAGFDQVDRFAVSLTDEDAARAREVPVALVRNYITQTSERIAARLAANRDFVLKQFGECRSRLEELTRQSPPAPQPEPQPAPPLPEKPDPLASVREQIRQIGSDMDALRRRQAEARQKLEGLKAPGEAPRPMDKPIQVVKGPNPNWTALKQQRARLQEELDTAVSIKHMTEKHPTVEALRKKIDSLTAQMEQLPQEVVLHTIYGSAEPAKEDLSGPLAAAQAEIETTTRELERLQQRLAGVQDLLAAPQTTRQERPPSSPPQAGPRNLKQIAEVRSEAARWEQRLAETQAALDAEWATRRDQLAAVRPAELRRSFPLLWQVLGAAFAGGILFGMLGAMGVGALSRSFAGAEEVARHVDVPVLGVTSRILTPRQEAFRRARRLVLVPMISLLLTLALGLGTLNAVLWLECPDQYGQWSANPADFVCRQWLAGPGKM